MSLKYRIAVVIFLLEAVMMIFVFSTTLSRSQEINKQQFDVNENVILDLLADLSRFALFSLEYEDLQPYIEKISEDPHVKKILVVDRNNHISASSDVSDVGSDLPELKNSEHSYWRSKEVNNASGLLGQVIINFSNFELDTAKQEVLWVGVKVALVGMTVIAVVGFLTGYLLTRRLGVLTDAAQCIKDGDLQVQTRLTGNDELALLGQVFDDMTSSFKSTIEDLNCREQELNKIRDELEQRVMERTSELEMANEELEHLATHDPLTKLPNRSLLLVRLHQCIHTCELNQSSFATFMIDLDRFKQVNDTLGHDVGDKLLIQVSARISGILRKSDTVARLGGDEFAIALCEIGLEQATRIAGKISDCLAEPFNIDDSQFNIGSSIGIAMYPEHGTDSASLLKCADAAMYIAKRNHLNHLVYDPNTTKDTDSKLTLDTTLRQAIDADEFLLQFQPKLDFKNGNIVGVEALLRWWHQGRLILPNEFIPYAEQTGLVKKITLWVIDHALQQLTQWQAYDAKLKMSINLSAKDLDNPALLDHIESALKRWNTPPESLILEITETSVMADPNRALTVLQNLDKMGVGISIDDFGTGYSSLMYLKKLPLDEIKIDRSFVTNIQSDPESYEIVRAIIDLAHNLRIQVTAEGIESQEDWDTLAALQCDTAQGIYSGAPMSSDEIQPILAGPDKLQEPQISGSKKAV